jgi:hypothetical protein
MIRALFLTEDLAARALGAILARGVTSDDVTILKSQPASWPKTNSHRVETALWAVGTPLLSIVVLTVPGAAYALALLAVVVAIFVKPLDAEHWLQVRDEVYANGGAVLEIAHFRYHDQRLMNALRAAGAVDVRLEETV